jgi:YggT family protein
MQAILFILNALLTMVVVVFLLRTIMPYSRADFRNAIGQAVLKVTNPLVMPLRKVFKPVGKLDLASVVALVLVQVAGTAIIMLVAGIHLGPVGALIAGLRELLQTILQFYTVAILIYALLSWVAPGTHSPANELLGRICEPLLRPVRRVVPPLGGLDLSALFVLIGLQALQILLH